MEGASLRDTNSPCPQGFLQDPRWDLLASAHSSYHSSWFRPHIRHPGLLISVFCFSLKVSLQLAGTLDVLALHQIQWSLAAFTFLGVWVP
jgi:hypothetical protein